MGKKILFLLTILLFSCDSNDSCDTVVCAAPITFTGISVYFVDKETDENSFVSGSLTFDDIVVTDIDNTIVEKELQEIELQDSDLRFRSHFIVIYDDFKPGENKYNFRVKNNLEYDMVLNATENTSGCCLGIYLDDLQINGVEHNLENSIYLPIIYIN